MYFRWLQNRPWDHPSSVSVFQMTSEFVLEIIIPLFLYFRWLQNHPWEHPSCVYVFQMTSELPLRSSFLCLCISDDFRIALEIVLPLFIIILLPASIILIRWFIRIHKLKMKIEMEGRLGDLTTDFNNDYTNFERHPLTAHYHNRYYNVNHWHSNLPLKDILWQLIIIIGIITSITGTVVSLWKTPSNSSLS